MIMKHYVAGFLFSEDKSKVVLIAKNRPEFQAGKLNAVGGKIEDYDKNNYDAMRREFREETGVFHKDWDQFAVIKEKDTFRVDFFVSTGNVSECQTTTDEKIFIVDLKYIHIFKTMSNLNWLIPLALNHLNEGEKPKLTIAEY